jgi:carbamoyl-phosphate synthase large subunit
VLEAARRLAAMGFRLIATGGTQRFLVEQGVACEKVNKVLEGRPHIVDAMKNGSVQLVFNTTEGASALEDSKSIRQAALLGRIPYYTTLAGCLAATGGIAAMRSGGLEVRPLQDYHTPGRRV